MWWKVHNILKSSVDVYLSVILEPIHFSYYNQSVIIGQLLTNLTEYKFWTQKQLLRTTAVCSFFNPRNKIHLMHMTSYRVFHDLMSEHQEVIREVILSEKIIHMATFSECPQQ